MRNGMACCLWFSVNAVYLVDKNKKTRIDMYRKYGWTWSKIAKIYGVTPLNVRRCIIA